MKKKMMKTKGVAKGAPSGFVISLMVHAVAFLLAGMFVVFTVTQKEEKKFVPPKPVDRPKMKLKKPKVKVKKNSKPKATTRIVTKVKRASMPDIQLPEMSGIGDGLVSGIGGFEILPDLSEVTIFGAGQTIGNDFVGTFYDFKRDRRGRPVAMTDVQFVDELIGFTQSGWKTSKISRFYRSPKKLYATSLMMPPVRSSVAPAAFNEADTVGYAWMVHYKGQLVHKDGITFRFWGHGDDVMCVRVNGKLVLNACWPDYDNRATYLIGGKWDSDSPQSRQYYLGNNTAVVGDWITLEPGVPLDMEAIIGEVPGGTFCSMLVVEVEGEDYETSRQNMPILPIFKTTEPSLDLIDAISAHLVPEEASITNGPVFRDYAASGRARESKQEETPEPEMPKESPLRVWTSTDGKSIEAEFLSVVAGKVVLRNEKGKQLKLAAELLSPEDRVFIELSNPPDLDITFTKKSTQRLIETTPYLEEIPPKILDYTFSTKVRQTSARDYNHELTVEYFAVGQRFVNQDQYQLLERKSSSFIPTRENQRSHEFSGEPIELIEYDLAGSRRGIRYAENLVLISDARGEIVAHSTSAAWLIKYVDNLRKIPVGRYLDKTCKRTIPTGPKSDRY